MSRVLSYQHVAAGNIVSAPGASKALLEQRVLRNSERVLVISDEGVRGAGVLEPVLAGLGDKVACVDTAVRPDGDVRHVEALAARANDQNVDAIVAVGGGSVMDTAKGVNVVMTKGGTLQDSEGYAKVKAKLATLVCVPTTAGTGSECTQFAVVADPEAKRKLILIDQALVPTLGVLDPELLLGLPTRVTAATGVDAITHAVEALASRMRHPFGAAMATEALRLLVREEGLARSLADPNDLSARAATQNAAALAGQAVSTSMLGACHAFAHALGGRFGVPHGVANGVFLLPVMRYNLPRAGAAYARLGQALGGNGEEDALVTFALDAIERVVHEVAGIPKRLSDLGVTEQDLSSLAELTLRDPDLATNPVAFKDAEPVLGLLRACL